MIACPPHLAALLWYQPHQAWVRAEYGACGHDPGSAAPKRAYLTGANLTGANLTGADLARADLAYANFDGANLVAANLVAANLAYADLAYANFDGANLTGADLARANLVAANLAYANLAYANLAYAILDGATMPDGRVWEAYAADHLAGLCDAPEVRARAIAAWGSHAWGTGPMSMAHGWTAMADVPSDLRLRVAAWVALYDAGLLQRPEVVAVGWEAVP